MSYQEVLSGHTVAISISESDDMSALGLTVGHLGDAMAELARHLLALGAGLIYGGDLRRNGFSDLLFELVARYRRDVTEDGSVGVTNFLAWPSHIQLSADDITIATDELSGSADLKCLDIDGIDLSPQDRAKLKPRQPTQTEWTTGLTAMRRRIAKHATARIVLGGQRSGFRGVMPGIAEEALISLEFGQPLFILGGFGGCARDLAESIGLLSPVSPEQAKAWASRQAFEQFSSYDLHNGLTLEENAVLAVTPHVDQAIALVMRGLMRCSGGPEQVS